jgi:hypothetical protein
LENIKAGTPEKDKPAVIYEDIETPETKKQENKISIPIEQWAKIPNDIKEKMLEGFEGEIPEGMKEWVLEGLEPIPLSLPIPKAVQKVLRRKEKICFRGRGVGKCFRGIGIKEYDFGDRIETFLTTKNRIVHYKDGKIIGIAPIKRS